MKTGYPTVELARIKSSSRYSLIGGPFGSKLVQKDYTAVGVPVIRGANLPHHKRFSFDDFVYVPSSKVARDLSSNLAFPGDIVVTQRGTLGQVGLIPRDSRYGRFVLSQSQMKLSVDPSKADAEYVYYALRSPIGQHEIISRALTAGVPHINLAIFGEVRIPLPRLNIQHKVAAVLSAYDDLLENNARRIKALEEMAQRVYREWFVDFRFPGDRRAGHILSGSSLPEGWSIERVGDTFETMGGGTPAREERSYWHGGDVNWYTPSDLTSSKSVFMRVSKTRITQAGLQHSSARLFPSGAVMMTSRATIGVIAIAATEACTNQGFIICLPNERVSTFYLYFWLRQMRDQIESIASGATFKEISRSEFRDLHIAVPCEDAHKRFVELVNPIFGMIKRLEVAIEVTRASRDLLLPRLISGEVDVEDLDIATAGSSA